MKLLKKLKKNEITISSKELISGFAKKVNSIESLKDFSSLKELFSDDYEAFVTSPKFENKIEQVVEYEIDSTEVNQYEELIDELKELEQEFDYLLDEEINNLSEKHAELMDEIDRKMEKEDMDYSYEAQEYEEAMEREEQFISNLFDGLAEE